MADDLKIRDYVALQDALAAYQLWETSGCYPMDSMVFNQYVSGRQSYFPGDVIVAERGGVAIGIGVIEVDGCRESSDQAAILLILVSLDERRRGVGSALLAELERRLLHRGIARASVGGLFWPGVPDSSSAAPFFANNGYDLSEERFDVVIPASGVTVSETTRGILRELCLDVRCMSVDDLVATIDYQSREFPWWRAPLLEILPQDMQDVVIVKRGDEVIGSAMALTPKSRTIIAGLQRQSEADWTLGALGAVGVAKKWRGKGLGMALCQVAAEHICQAGATHIYVEEVERHIVPFYEKMGGSLHGRCLQGDKVIGG